MGILIWIIFGALAGWLASLFMNTDSSQGTVGDIILGIVGGLVGGMLMNTFGGMGVTGFNMYSLGVAVIGAVIVIYVGRLIKR